MLPRRKKRWLIVSEENPKYRVILGECPREHAEHVRGQLETDPYVPGKLKLRKTR